MSLLAVVATFLVTSALILLLRPIATAIGLVDVPGGRKNHGAAIPLVGGLCMSVGLGCGAALLEQPPFWTPIMVGIYLLVLVGTIDDYFDLPPSVRLAVQSGVALLVVIASGICVTTLGEPLFFAVPLGPLAVPFTLLFIMTLINALNMADGIDGLAGGLALVALVSLALLGVGSDIFSLTLLLIAAVAAFLLFNVPLRFVRPLRTFMGDAGSTFLGFAIGTVGVALSQGDVPRLSPVTGLWLVAIPVFELFSSIVRRTQDGRSPLAPDHDHLHHVLMKNGLSRSATLGLILGLAAACACVGIVGRALDAPDGVMLIAWFLAGTVYFQCLRRPRVVGSLIRALPARSKVQSA